MVLSEKGKEERPHMCTDCGSYVVSFLASIFHYLKQLFSHHVSKLYLQYEYTDIHDSKNDKFSGRATHHVFLDKKDNQHLFQTS